MGCSGSKQMNVQDLNPITLFENKGDVNSRCNIMLKDCTDFVNKVKKDEKDLRNLGKAAETALESIRQGLETPIPRLLRDTSDTHVTGTLSKETMGGNGTAIEALARAKTEMVFNLQAGVFGPMDHFVAQHTECVAKQKQVNAAFGEMGACRKKLETLQAKLATLQGKASSDPKAATQAQEAQSNVQVAEGKLQVAIEKHEQEEAAQYARLVNLVGEAASLRGVYKASVAKMAEAMATAQGGIAEYVAPPPATPSSVPTTPQSVATPVVAPAPTAAVPNGKHAEVAAPPPVAPAVAQ